MPTARVPEPVTVTGFAPAEGSVTTTGTDVFSVVVVPATNWGVEDVMVTGETVGIA